VTGLPSATRALGLAAVLGNALGVAFLWNVPSPYRPGDVPAWLAGSQAQPLLTIASAWSFVAGLVALAGFMWLLALSAAVAPDPNAPIAPLLTTIAGLTAGWVALLVLLVAETDEGFANIYSAAVSAQNIWPRMGQRTLAVAVGGIVLVFAATVPLVQYESFLLLIGSVFVPLLGILTADYFVVRGRQYTVPEISASRIRPAAAPGAARRGIAASSPRV